MNIERFETPEALAERLHPKSIAGFDTLGYRMILGAVSERDRQWEARVAQFLSEMSFAPAVDVFAACCKFLQKWGLMISFPSPQSAEELEELCKACPCTSRLTPQAIDAGEASLFLDTEEEMRNLFRQTVGDDGPTKQNPYSGPFRVYAVTCGPDGKILGENT